MDPIITVQACGLTIDFLAGAKDLAVAFVMLATGFITDVQFVALVKSLLGHVPPIAEMAVKACVGTPS